MGHTVIPQESPEERRQRLMNFIIGDLVEALERIEYACDNEYLEPTEHFQLSRAAALVSSVIITVSKRKVVKSTT